MICKIVPVIWESDILILVASPFKTAAAHRELKSFIRRCRDTCKYPPDRDEQRRLPGSSETAINYTNRRQRALHSLQGPQRPSNLFHRIRYYGSPHFLLQRNKLTQSSATSAVPETKCFLVTLIFLAGRELSWTHYWRACGYHDYPSAIH